MLDILNNAFKKIWFRFTVTRLFLTTFHQHWFTPQQAALQTATSARTSDQVLLKNWEFGPLYVTFL